MVALLVTIASKQMVLQSLQIAQGYWRQSRWVIRKSVKVSIATVGVHNCPVILFEEIISSTSSFR